MKTTSPVHTSPWAHPSGANAGLTSRVATQTVRNWKGLGKGIAIAAAVITLAIGAGYVAAQPFDAAPPVAVVDAAPSSPAPDAAPAPHTTIADPTVAPGEYIDDVRTAKRHGWPLAILVAVYGVLIALIRRGWLKKVSGTVAAIGSGASLVIAAVIDAVMGGGSWFAAAFAGGGALLLLFAPQNTPAAKGKGG